ncbi:MAG: LytTR family transcriptional regulator [Clostridiaceae bacterium]|nr:LytTR family transcriptional regulator [Clostridiaceae bacterium]
MRISIEEINREIEEEVIIRCHQVDDEIIQIMNRLKSKTVTLVGYDGDIIYRIKPNDIFYIEAVEGKVFIYCRDRVYESKQKLYELEQICGSKRFFRASKSLIINITKISHIKPSISGRFEAGMENGETIVVSRQYVPVLKSMLGL